MENDQKCYRKAILLITNLYQSNIAKSREGNKVEHIRSKYRSYDTFLLQGKVSPLEIALGEILLPTANRWGRGWNKNVLGGKFLKN